MTSRPQQQQQQHFLFSGDHRTRPRINLGGARADGDVLSRARVERLNRERHRAHERAALTIQRFYRGRRAAAAVKQQLRTELDRALVRGISSPADVALTATLLVRSFPPLGTASDLRRAAAWARAVVAPAPASRLPLILQLAHSAPSRSSDERTCRQVAELLLTQASLSPFALQSPLFLEVVKMLLDVELHAKLGLAATTQPLELAVALVKNGFYARLRAMLTASVGKSPSPALGSAAILALLPFKLAASSGPSRSSDDLHVMAGTDFATRVLTVPRLATVLPQAAKSAIAKGVSLPSICATLVNAPDTLEPLSIGHMLANLATLSPGGKLVRALDGADAAMATAYLGLLRVCLCKLPRHFFVAAAAPATHSAPDDGTHPDSDDDDDDDDGQGQQQDGAADNDGDTLMAVPVEAVSRPVRAEIGPVARQLVSQEHLARLLFLSASFPTRTRAPLAAVLVSLIALFPSSRADILGAILYSPSSSHHAGRGLLREIWRAWVVTSSLAGALSAGDRLHPSLVYEALASPDYADTWPFVILLMELYSRCLLTMGDDEFFDDSAPLSGRNPLSLDEVIQLSALLRNVAFQLYWTSPATFCSTPRFVSGLGRLVRYHDLRELATKLLQQVYARDSRRAFAPPDHWLMTSAIDMNSFIQTVVLEEQVIEQSSPAAESSSQALPSFVQRSRQPLAGLRRSAGQAQKLSRLRMSYLSPRLGVLNNIPFVIPFETRVAIFRQFVATDRERVSDTQPVRARIRRDRVAEDSFSQLNAAGGRLKARVQVTFVDQWGLEEAGIDGGGLFKELLTSLSKEVFHADHGLWLATAAHELFPNPHGYAKEQYQLEWFRFLGRILGKALYEGILLDVRFAGFFLAKWLGRQSYLDDLASLDEDLYHGLLALKNYPGDVENDLALDFSVSEEELGVSRTIDLIPNGRNVPVTNENKIRYIYLVSHYRLNSQIDKQCSAFFSGLSEIVPERFLRMFNVPELRVLVGGADEPIDVDDLQANTVYGGWEDSEANSTIRLFWQVVRGLDQHSLKQLVKFVTSCPRPPLLGFSELNPKFAIQKGGTDVTRLPSSSTCVNLLKLPEYKDRATMREKLLYAINADAGFSLS